MMSGRLTPAAATRNNTSPSPGLGKGRRQTRSCSGPPGEAISTAVICEGNTLGLPGGKSRNSAAGHFFPSSSQLDEASRGLAVHFAAGLEAVVQRGEQHGALTGRELDFLGA